MTQITDSTNYRFLAPPEGTKRIGKWRETRNIKINPVHEGWERKMGECAGSEKKGRATKKTLKKSFQRECPGGPGASARHTGRESKDPSSAVGIKHLYGDLGEIGGTLLSSEF